MKVISLYVFLFVCGTIAFSQSEQRNKVKYTHEFRFTEGLFLNFEQVIENDPIRKYLILTNADYHDPEFFDKVLSNDAIFYFDENSVRQEISLENIWGYSRNGVLYIKMEENFMRITIVGGICHFVGAVTSMDTRYINPYHNPYSYNNYYNPYSYYNSYYSPMQSTTYKRTEMKQFILDFETGKVMDYNIANLEIALMRDPELYDEYIVLNSKRKKQLKFLYIRKFNERNAIYFNK